MRFLLSSQGLLKGTLSVSAGSRAAHPALACIILKQHYHFRLRAPERRPAFELSGGSVAAGSRAADPALACIILKQHYHFRLRGS
jgi:hypothetical protein